MSSVTAPTLLVAPAASCAGCSRGTGRHPAHELGTSPTSRSPVVCRHRPGLGLRGGADRHAAVVSIPNHAAGPCSLPRRSPRDCNDHEPRSGVRLRRARGGGDRPRRRASACSRSRPARHTGPGADAWLDLLDGDASLARRADRRAAQPRSRIHHGRAGRGATSLAAAGAACMTLAWLAVLGAALAGVQSLRTVPEAPHRPRRYWGPAIVIPPADRRSHAEGRWMRRRTAVRRDVVGEETC